MIYADTIQVLDESSPRMTQHNLYTFSHSKGGFSYYDIVLTDESMNEDMKYIEDTMTRQGIACVIYPDRFTDYVIVIKFSPVGDLIREQNEYSNIVKYTNELKPYEMSRDLHDVEFIKHLTNWDNQIRLGNIYSIKQFMKPDKE